MASAGCDTRRAAGKGQLGTPEEAAERDRLAGLAGARPRETQTPESEYAKTEHVHARGTRLRKTNGARPWLGRPDRAAVPAPTAKAQPQASTLDAPAKGRQCPRRQATTKRRSGVCADQQVARRRRREAGREMRRGGANSRNARKPDQGAIARRRIVGCAGWNAAEAAATGTPETPRGRSKVDGAHRKLQSIADPRAKSSMDRPKSEGGKTPQAGAARDRGQGAGPGAKVRAELT